MSEGFPPPEQERASRVEAKSAEVLMHVRAAQKGEKVNVLEDGTEVEKEPNPVEVLRAGIRGFADSKEAELSGQLADRLEAEILALPPEERNELTNVLAEGNLYAIKQSSGRSKRALELYASVSAQTEGALTPEKSKERSAHFHSEDRQGDTLLVSGNFGPAAEKFAHAYKIREELDLITDPDEIGPAACARYGEAAALFMTGKLEGARAKVADARELLTGIEAKEPVLEPNVRSLEQAIADMEKIEDEDERNATLAALAEIITENGGSGGGVKRINFKKELDAARAKASPEKPE
ncbi:MAG: hypothetical protein AAB515_02025 [Patescibacteria group bacterium]